jgi:ArsR family transcriptional regulator
LEEAIAPPLLHEIVSTWGTPMETSTTRRLLPGLRTPEPASDRVLAARLKALGDPTRLRILRLLLRCPEPVCVCEISSGHDLGQPTISHHLKILREAGFIRAQRRGTWIYYRPNRYAVGELSSAILHL